MSFSLRSEQFANQVIASCQSTNDLAKVLASEGYPHGTWVSSLKQASGRGRLGREWRSLDGNLFLSLVARIEEPALWTWVPLATALGIVSALEEILPEVPFRIKWPNDIWVHGKKLGGILCESSSSTPGGAIGALQSSIVVGIGLNVAQKPEGQGVSAVCLEELSRERCSLERIRGRITHFVLAELQSLRHSSMLPESSLMRSRYLKRSVLEVGSAICWGEGQKRHGVVLGLGDSGELRVHEEGRGELALYAEEVALIRAN